MGPQDRFGFLNKIFFCMVVVDVLNYFALKKDILLQDGLLLLNVHCVIPPWICFFVLSTCVKSSPIWRCILWLVSSHSGSDSCICERVLGCTESHLTVTVTLQYSYSKYTVYNEQYYVENLRSTLHCTVIQCSWSIQNVKPSTAGLPSHIRMNLPSYTS